MRGALRPWTMGLVALGLAQVGCRMSPSVADLWHFGATKRVAVTATLRLVVEGEGRAVSETPTRYLLNAYEAGGDVRRVPLARAGESGGFDLPMTLSGAVASVALVAEVPVDLAPDASGHYALRFSATASGARAAATGEPGTRAASGPEAALEALAPAVRANVEAAENAVELSVISTLALEMLGNQEAGLGAPGTLTAYTQLVGLLGSRQAQLEQALGAADPLAPTAYASFIATALRASAVADRTLQGKLALALTGAQTVARQPVDRGGALTQYANLINIWAATSQAQMQAPGSPAASRLPPSLIDQVAAALTAPAKALALAPAAVSLEDLDLSVGLKATVLIQAPSAGGVDSYNVYLGGHSVDSGRGQLLGRAPGKLPTTTLAVQVAALDAAVTSIWVWPVSGGSELPCPVERPLPGRGTAAAPGAAALAQVGQPTLAGHTFSSLTFAWPSVAGATSYNLYRASSSPVNRTTAKCFENVTSPWAYTERSPGSDYFIRVAAVRDGIEGPWSAEVGGMTDKMPVPSQVQLTTQNPAAVGLSWAPIAGISQYVVRWTDDGTPVAANSPQYVYVDTTSWSKTFPPDGRSRSFAVQARYHDYYESELSAAVSVPGAPATLAVVSRSATHQIDVEWEAVPNATSYLVTRASTSPVSASGAAAIEVTSGTSYTFNGVATEGDFFVGVRAKINGTVGAWSDEGRVTLATLVMGDRQDAYAAIGQPTLQDTGVAHTASGFGARLGLMGLATDHHDRVYVGDGNVNRLAVFDKIPLASGADALFTVNGPSASAGGPGNSSSGGFNQILGLAATGSMLVAVDGAQQRTLLFEPLPTQGPTPASSLLGNTAFDLPPPAGVSADTQVGPAGVAAFGGRVVVADQAGNRVLVYRPRASRLASLVLGQPDFEQTTANHGGSPSASTLSGPTGVWTDGRRLLVMDTGNARVLLWKTFPTQHGQPADLVLGQPDMTTASGQSGAVDPSQHASASKLGGIEVSIMSGYHPTVASNGTQIAVGDPANYRVLIYDHFPTANGEAASVVLGQIGMTDAVAPTSPQPYTVVDPTGMVFSGTHLLVLDAGIGRVSVFGPYLD